MSRQRPNRGLTDEWLTPPDLLEALGPFDLDPCAPVERPWPTAARHYTAEDDGMAQPWEGRVWLNPPYGPLAGMWVRRLADHGNGVALLYCRTETRMFFESVWPRASGLLFLRGRLRHFRVDGSQAGNAPASSVLIAYDRYDSTVQNRRALGSLAEEGWGAFVHGIVVKGE